MKKKLICLLTSGFILLSSSSVFADEISDKIADLESRIYEIEQEIVALKAEYSTETTVSVESDSVENDFSYSMDGHTFTYVKNEVCPDHEGKDRVLIYFDYMNNTGETTTPSYSLNVTAFQNGIELDFAGWMGSGIVEEDYFYKNVQDGASLPIAIGFSLMDDSDVSIEINPFFWTDKTPIGEYTFALNK